MDDQRLERIENKVDVLSDKLSDTNIILAKQHESLVHHIKRTDLLEKQIRPIQTHIDRVQGVFKFVMFAAAVAAIIEAVHMVLK
jgi:chaperonin cofactor prefoldin